MIQLPTLDQIALETISLYKNLSGIPQIDISKFKRPLVVGSGNGYYTGRILFRKVGAFFANESEVEEKIKNIHDITDVVVISASWEKHAPIILKSAKELGKETFLISSSKDSSGKSIADDSIIMPKVSEPYTYNTSTYFGYMFAENPDTDLQELENFLRNTISPILVKTELSEYSSFCIVIPDEFVLLREMFETKFIELFGRKVARDVFSYEQMKHAITVVQDEKELFICFWNNSEIVYGENQINIPLPENPNYSTMMLLGYYVIGKIQSSFPAYFMESIEEYVDRAFLQSGFHITPLVKA